jgi:1,4-alpha-glucan branching enzyme
MWTHPGKKLLFMGSEFGQRREWTHEGELEWWVLQYADHGGLKQWVADLNRVYRAEPALHEIDFESAGFEWIDASDHLDSTLSYVRRSRNGELVLVVCNFTPMPRHNFAVGVPRAGYWRELANSDARDYGGSGMGNLGGVVSQPIPAHGRNQSLTLTLPPLSTVIFKCESNR